MLQMLPFLASDWAMNILPTNRDHPHTNINSFTNSDHRFLSYCVDKSACGCEGQAAQYTTSGAIITT